MTMYRGGLEDFEVVSCERITDISCLQRGDHLAVKGTASGIGYTHHGIFLGHEIGVADVYGESKLASKVQIRDLTAFTDSFNRDLYRLNYKTNFCLSKEKTAKNAEKVAEDPIKWDAYSLMRNNCEHFATWCKTGEKRSDQVLNAVALCLAAVAFPAAVALL